MRLPRLDSRVALERRATSGDGAGGQQANWSTIFERSAAIMDLRSGESVMADRLQGMSSVIVRLRTDSQSALVTADWRLRDVRAGTLYAIKGVTPARRRGFIDLLCQSGVAT